MNRMKVGVLGATGMVGQNYLTLLANHPWFDVVYVGASPRSAGKTFAQAVAGRWLMAKPIPSSVHDLIVADANGVDQAIGQCDMVFSAIESDKDTIRRLEEAYAAANIPVVSNNSAHCNRVSVIDGHTACVSLRFQDRKPSLDEVKKIWQDFASEPQRLELPSAPIPAMIYREEPDRPQPRLDRDAGHGMAVTLGRLRPCPVFNIRVVGLSHNTIRGAAGGAILTAELLKAKGYILGHDHDI